MPFTMPERTPEEGAIGVSCDKQEITISVTHHGVEQHLRMGHHNAARVLGALSMLLDAPLQKSVAKQIKF